MYPSIFDYFIDLFDYEQEGTVAIFNYRALHYCLNLGDYFLFTRGRLLELIDDYKQEYKVSKTHEELLEILLTYLKLDHEYFRVTNPMFIDDDSAILIFIKDIPECEKEETYFPKDSFTVPQEGEIVFKVGKFGIFFVNENEANQFASKLNGWFNTNHPVTKVDLSDYKDPIIYFNSVRVSNPEMMKALD
nr:MAG TPA: hypothetical protein [Caudoviricetes sp.]